MTADVDTPAFRLPVRVFYSDTDAGGIVYYANYLKYFEHARTEWLRALGVSQQSLRDETGAIFVVVESHLHYHRPARLDDQLEVTVDLSRCGRASWVFAQQALRGEDLLCEGEVRVGCVDALTLKPRRFPDAVMRALT